MCASHASRPTSRIVVARAYSLFKDIGLGLVLERFEQYALCKFAANTMQALGQGRGRLTGEFAHWLKAHADLVGGPKPSIAFDEIGSDGHGLTADQRKALAPLIGHLEKSVKPPAASGLERRLSWLCETLSLTEVEADVLKVKVRLALFAPVEELAKTAFNHHRRASPSSLRPRDDIQARILATLAGLSASSVYRALQPERSLTVLGLLEGEGEYCTPSRTVLRIACHSKSDPDQIRSVLIGKAGETDLGWEDFSHLGEIADLAERLVAGALKQRAMGVNILLHGEPGTGKTEFVRALAQRLGARPVFVGEADNDDGEPNRSERIAAFALVRSIAGRTGRMVLVVDEADDIFTGVDEGQAKGRVGSKVFMNRLVETTEAPTIWITNRPYLLGPAVLRRMALAIGFSAPSQTIRRQVAERIARRRKVKLSADALDRISGIEVTPAIIDGALRVAKLAGGQEAAVTAAARSVMEVVAGPKPPPALGWTLGFDPALSSADQDLMGLADRISRGGDMAVSLCLYGLPGTGKSAFARYLAQRLGLDAIEKRASDILSMWVGETEKQIAEAFGEAMRRKAVLIIDEADTFLLDRSGAQRSWEVSQVNEMLTWMERHRYPTVFTTNLMDSLDPAALRRFLFKVRFLPMTPDQAKVAFQRAFGAQAPRQVADLSPLAPGDFALVARKARVMGETDPVRLAAMLAEEVEAKAGSLTRKIGF